MSRVSPTAGGARPGTGFRRRHRATWSLVAAAGLAVGGAVPAVAATTPDHGTRTPTVVNPGFEADGTGVAAPLGWSTSGTSTASYSELGGRSGSYRLSHWSPNAYRVDTYQTVTDIAPGDYTLGVWIRTFVPNFLAADISFETIILLGLLTGPRWAMLGGSILSIPAMLHGEYLSLPFDTAVGLL